MTAQVLGAIASSATTVMLGLIVFWIRVLVKRFGIFRKEHEFLMSTTRSNTAAIKRILAHLDLGE